MFRDLMQKTAGLRRPGSAALDLAYAAAAASTASGKFDLQPWDIAAGCADAQEAGGLVGDFKGDEDYLRKRQHRRRQPKMFAQLLQIIAPHLAPELKV